MVSTRRSYKKVPIWVILATFTGVFGDNVSVLVVLGRRFPAGFGDKNGKAIDDGVMAVAAGTVET